LANSPGDIRKDNGLQRPQFLDIGEYSGAELRAVDRALGIENVLPEMNNNLLPNRRLSERLVAELIGVDDGAAVLDKLRRHGALAAADAADETKNHSQFQAAG